MNYKELTDLIASKQAARQAGKRIKRHVAAPKELSLNASAPEQPSIPEQPSTPEPPQDAPAVPEQPSIPEQPQAAPKKAKKSSRRKKAMTEVSDGSTAE